MLTSVPSIFAEPRLEFIERLVAKSFMPPFILPDAARFSGKVTLAGKVPFGNKDRISLADVLNVLMIKSAYNFFGSGKPLMFPDALISVAPKPFKFSFSKFRLFTLPVILVSTYRVAPADRDEFC